MRAVDLSLGELVPAFTTYGADHPFHVAVLLQTASELDVLLQAMQNGCADGLAQVTLAGIARRAEIAAKLGATP